MSIIETKIAMYLGGSQLLMFLSGYKSVKDFFISTFFVLLTIILWGGIYYLPTIIASLLKRGNQKEILVMNTFIGWTVIGWIYLTFKVCQSKRSLIDIS